jgi:hypothetical protein
MFGRGNLLMWNALGMKQDLCGVKPTTTVQNMTRSLGYISVTWYQVNNTVQKAWRALHFVMRVVKKGNKNTKSVAYKLLVRPILEYGAACWDPYRECQTAFKTKQLNLCIIQEV